MACQFEIAQLIGRDNFKKLARAKAGQRIYIPVKLTGSCELVQLLGWPVAKVISDSVGGEVLHIANGEVLSGRNGFIKTLVVGGWSVNEIHQRLGLSERAVRQIAQTVTADERSFLAKFFRNKKQKEKKYVTKIKNQTELF